MANFGQRQRQLTQDTLAGNIAAPVVAPAQSGTGFNTTQRTVVQPDKTTAMQALLKHGAPVAAAYDKRTTARQFEEGYEAAGTEEGYKRVAEAEPFLSRILAGPSATVRGAQDRILNDRADKSYINLYQKLSKEGAAMDTDQWREVMDVEFGEMSKDIDDTELRTSMRKRFAEHRKNLTSAQIKQHSIFVKEAVFQSSSARFNTASRMASALALGDSDDNAHKDELLAETFTRDEDHTDESWANVVTGAITNELSLGRNAMYEYAVANEHLSGLNGQQLDKIERGSQLYQQRNDIGSLIATKTMGDLINGGDVDGVMRSWDKNANRFPLAFRDKNAALQQAADRQEVLRAERVAEEADVHSLLAGSPEWRTIGAKAQRKSMRTALQRMAETGVRDELEANNPPDYDPNAPLTQRQKTDWLDGHPREYARLLVNSDVKNPEIEQRLIQTTSILRNLDATDQDVETAMTSMKFLKVIEDEAPEYFKRHQTDGTQAAGDFSDLYQRLVVDNPSNPLAAVKQLRLQRERVADGFTQPALTDEALTDAYSSVSTDFIDKMEESPWYKFSQDDPRLRQYLDFRAQSLFDEEYALSGDIGLATKRAVNRMTESDAIVGNAYVQGGAQIDRAMDGQLHEYAQVLSESPEFRQYLKARGVDTRVAFWFLSKEASNNTLFKDRSSIIPLPEYENAFLMEFPNDEGPPAYIRVPIMKDKADWPIPQPGILRRAASATADAFSFNKVPERPVVPDVNNPDLGDIAP